MYFFISFSPIISPSPPAKTRQSGILVMGLTPKLSLNLPSRFFQGGSMLRSLSFFKIVRVHGQYNIGKATELSRFLNSDEL